jgi:hypothetical protein
LNLLILYSSLKNMSIDFRPPLELLTIAEVAELTENRPGKCEAPATATSHPLHQSGRQRPLR